MRDQDESFLIPECNTLGQFVQMAIELEEQALEQLQQNGVVGYIGADDLLTAEEPLLKEKLDLSRFSSDQLNSINENLLEFDVSVLISHRVIQSYSLDTLRNEHFELRKGDTVMLSTGIYQANDDGLVQIFSPQQMSEFVPKTSIPQKNMQTTVIEVDDTNDAEHVALINIINNKMVDHPHGKYIAERYGHTAMVCINLIAVMSVSIQSELDRRERQVQMRTFLNQQRPSKVDDEVKTMIMDNRNFKPRH